MKTEVCDHDCFAEAATESQAMPGRVGWFIYVANDDDSHTHFRGNTAFAGRALAELAQKVIAGHENTGCVQCDTTALALANALKVYQATMAYARGPKC